MRAAILLFARAPVPGRAKSRLAPALGEERAAALHAAFVRDMLENMLAFSDLADIELHTDTLTDAWADVKVATYVQAEGGLELKMFQALDRALRAGAMPAVVAGSDAPTLPRAHMAELLASRAEATFGPCEDGGYWAVACRRVHPDMFRGVEWSTPRALEQSEAAARACGMTTARGPVWFDVDEPADLERLLASGGLPRHTAAWAAR